NLLTGERIERVCYPDLGVDFSVESHGFLLGSFQNDGSRDSGRRGFPG
ncbi:hypothetical protein ABIB45_003648, partial [Arthrobacter sp. UYCo732]